jgi:hypothetical protein
VYHQRRHSEQEARIQSVIGLLEPHRPRVAPLNAVAAHVRFQQVVIFHFAHLKNKIKNSVVLLYDSLVAEKHSLRSISGVFEANEERAEHSGVQKETQKGLDGQNDGTLPATVVVRVWHTVTDGDHGFQGQVVCSDEASLKLKVTIFRHCKIREGKQGHDDEVDARIDSSVHIESTTIHPRMKPIC